MVAAKAPLEVVAESINLLDLDVCQKLGTRDPALKYELQHHHDILAARGKDINTVVETKDAETIPLMELENKNACCSDRH